MARVCGRPGSVVGLEELGRDPAMVRPWEVALPRWRGRRNRGSLLRGLWNLSCFVLESVWWLVSWAFILAWRLLDRRRVAPRERDMLRAGAHGESRVATELEKLPDEYWVLHDVRLEARESIRFDGVGLRSAQVDHLVVGPTGIFVIEAKCWSKDHAAEGTAFSPFQQVRRAGHLCYLLLKDEVGETQVRQVVVPVGAPLKPVNGNHVDLIWPSRLSKWIEGGNGSLPRDRVDLVAEALSRRVASRVAPQG